MAIEIAIGERTSAVELLGKDKSFYTFSVDGKEYVVDVVRLGKGIYSLIHNDISYYIELIEGKDSKRYYVTTKNRSYDLEIIDAESKYLKNRGKGGDDDSESGIVSPMPGKIVKIPVKKGDKLKAGDTAIIISAMKMESEYKAKRDCIVSGIHVNEGDTVDSNQTLITFDFE